MSTTKLLVMASLAACTRTPSPRAPAADPIAAVFARFKQASGGARWDRVVAVHSAGTLSAAGLTGPIDMLEDDRGGRSTTHYTLGPVSGASGYDGRVDWTLDPGGEVRKLDAPEALAEARTDAWMGAMAFWYPDRGSASYGAVEAHDDAGHRYTVVNVTPAGGVS